MRKNYIIVFYNKYYGRSQKNKAQGCVEFHWREFGDNPGKRFQLKHPSQYGQNWHDIDDSRNDKYVSFEHFFGETV